jgi:(R,R)-butanediol dehydrogenase / meso-butanediol dehydrogenase / diacetyl reductase
METTFIDYGGGSPALMKKLTIHFSVYYTPDDFRTVIDALATGAIAPGQLIGRTIGLNPVAEAFDLVAEGSTQGKILVDPS